MTKRDATQSSNGHDVLFEALKSCRVELAKKYCVRAYNVATDQMLHELCTIQPQSMDSLSDISGMGPHRIDRYGKQLLEIIQRHRV